MRLFLSFASFASGERVSLEITGFLLFLFPSAKNAGIDRFCYLFAQSLAGDVVGAEVLPRVNTAQSRFLRRRREAGEVARHSCQRFGSQSKEPGAVLQIEMMRKHGRLCDFIPKILDVAIPELPYLSLFCCSGDAANESKVFDFIEYFGISGAGQCRRRTGTKLVSPRQCKRSDLGPLSKI